MTQRDTARTGTLLVAALVVAMLALAGSFAWLRATLPSEPAVISIDAWDWSDGGPRVVPLGDGGPFRDGDRVVAIDGASMESLTAEALTPWGPGSRPPAIDGSRAFGIIRSGTAVELQVTMAPQPVGGLLAAAFALLTYTVVQAGVALLAWLRRPTEGWRRGFLLGSIANVANAVIWELGLRATDFDRPEPMLLLFALGLPMHLLFWSSITHLMVRWPVHATRVTGTRVFVAWLYLVPQLALATLLVLAAVATPSAIDWMGLAARLLALVVLGQIGLVLVALAGAYRRIGGAAGRSLRLIVAGCVAGALAVACLTVGPLLLTGQALAPRSAVATLGLPLAVVLLVATFRSRLFEVDLLIASRRRLIVAREEERRRLRRDLHDGIGPMLASMTLRADLARDLLREDPDGADAALTSLKADSQAAVAEIRRLTRELRPTAIDELGLVEAIRQRAADLAHPGAQDGAGRSSGAGGPGAGLGFEVSAGPLPPLDAALEVAAYRIAAEAMTNVIRHARATRCEVRLEGNGDLVLEVRDDGVGMAAGAPAGVGLTSMQERCAELGGRLSIERTDVGWTLIRAVLPTAG